MDITIAVPVIVALIEVIKRLGLKSRFAPALSVVMGVGLFALLGTSTLTGNLFEGLLAGLAASGVYSGVKASVRD